MKRLIGIVALFAFPGIAHAEWVRVAASANGSVTFIDPSSIVRTGSIVRAELLTEYSRQNLPITGAIKTIEITEFDCRLRRQTTKMITNFYPDQTSRKIPLNVVIDVEVGTTGEGALLKVCSLKSR